MTYARNKTVCRCANMYCLEEFAAQSHAQFCSTACRVQFNRDKSRSQEDRAVMRADAIRYLYEYRKGFNDALLRCVAKVRSL